MSNLEEPGQTNTIAQVTGYTPTINTRLLPALTYPCLNKMAYLRKRRYSRRSYAKSARKPRSRSARPSRYTGRTRRYTRKRGMSTRKVLDITSRKKRDTALTFSNTAPSGAAQPIAIGNYYVNGSGAGGRSVYCPTARSLVQFGGGSGTVVQEAMRTATSCYYRGHSEKIRIQTSSGLPWIWRRICFRLRGPSVFAFPVSGETPTIPQFSSLETSNGYKRVYVNMLTNAMPNTIDNQDSILFKGAKGVDWNDLITAPVDTRRVDLAYDKTRRISSGNANGILREYKIWHPMNKTLVYADDENGEVEDSGLYSVGDKRGMGDYYIFDVFQPGTGGSSSDGLLCTTTSSTYWHEK